LAQQALDGDGAPAQLPGKHYGTARAVAEDLGADLRSGGEAQRKLLGLLCLQHMERLTGQDSVKLCT
jgi:hypothetical protein